MKYRSAAALDVLLPKTLHDGKHLYSIIVKDRPHALGGLPRMLTASLKFGYTTSIIDSPFARADTTLGSIVENQAKR
jgi:hypothetical protein